MTSSPYDELVAVAVQVHELLLTRAETVGTAESLTGGLVVAALTSVPGASSTVRGGLVVYALDTKTSLAGVDPGLLDRRGPVAPEVAVALAIGARDRLHATWGVGLTGAAGPEAHGGRPPGTACVAVAGPDVVEHRTLVEPGSREAVRTAAGRAALSLLRTLLAQSGKATTAGSVET